MSDLLQISFLEDQKIQLEALIKEASEFDDIVGELNFKSRLKAVNTELENLVARDANVAEIAILFDGPPVLGQRSINAEFAAKAIGLFQKLVSTIFASNLSGELAKRGKIKGAELADLNIRGVATGSFGFILEEKDVDQVSVIKTPLREAVEEVINVFSEFTSENDDAYLIEVNDIHPRVFQSLGKFLEHIEKNEAVLKTLLPDRQLTFDRAGIRRAYDRFSNANVEISDAEWTGTLVGLSPIKRTFDFRRDGHDRIISGKFSQQVSQDYLERIDNRDGITLGDRFNAKIEIGQIRKPDGTISEFFTVTDLAPSNSH